MDDECILAYTAMSMSCASALETVMAVKLRATVSSNQSFCNSDPMASDDFSTRLTKQGVLHHNVMAPENVMGGTEHSSTPLLLTRKALANISPPELLDWLSGD